MPFSQFCSMRAFTLVMMLSSLLSGCSFNGSSTDAPAHNAAKLRPAPLPDTPQRVMLINEIIESSIIPAMKPDPVKDASSRLTPEKIDSLIAERKGKLGFVLPEDYWTLYRQNLVAFDEEAAQNKAQTLKRYSDEYRSRLQRLDDPNLELWATNPKEQSSSNNPEAFAEYKSMAIYYFAASKGVLLETINHHLDRMAQMDQQYAVCARYAECWKR
jgi:hypothetical protein